MCIWGGGVVLGSSWGPSISSYSWGSLSLRAFLNDCLKPSSTLMEPKLVSGAQGHFFLKLFNFILEYSQLTML